MASGLEIPENGSVPFGRAGAFVARASDPTAIIHNVAGLVGVPGVQLALAGNIGFFNHCFQREGNYPDETQVNIDNSGTIFENSMYANGATPYPRICNEPGANVTPNLMFSWRINRYVAIGLGVYGPSSTGARQIYPETVMTMNGLAPSPVRHMVYEKNLLLLHPSLAVAFQPGRGIRFGFVLQPSYASLNLTTMANSNGGAAQSPAGDVRTQLSAQGFFMAGGFGVQVVPSPYVSFGGSFHVNGTPRLSGTGTATANVYSSREADRVQSNFSIDRFVVPQPWNMRMGVRFVMPRVGRPTQDTWSDRETYDPMTDDVFDVEAEFRYEATSELSVTRLSNSGNINLGATSVPAPATSEVRSNFTDVMGVRVGGDVNIVPGRLSLRAGFAYDTQAQSNEYAQIHLPGYQTFSIHGGASLRLAFLTIHAGFAHFFMSDFNADRGIRAVTATGGTVSEAQCAGGSGAGACQVNRGQYQAYLNMVNVGLSARF